MQVARITGRGQVAGRPELTPPAYDSTGAALRAGMMVEP